MPVRLGITSMLPIARMASTTISSSSVKPLLPADVGVIFLTACPAIGAEGHQCVLSAGRGVLVLVAPWVTWHLVVQVGAVPGGTIRGVDHEAFEIIRVGADVEAVRIECGADGRDLRQRSITSGTTGLIEQIRSHHHGQHAEDSHDDQQLDDRETARSPVCVLVFHGYSFLSIMLLCAALLNFILQTGVFEQLTHQLEALQD